MKKILALAVWLSASQASATLFDSTQNHVGALLGPAIVNNDVGTKFAVGANADHFFNPYLAAGIYFTYNSLGSQGPSNSSLTNLLAEGKYYFEDYVSGLHLGFKTGLGFSSTSTTLTGQNGTSGTDIVFGPSAGLDYPFAQNLSLGGEANLLFVTTSSSLTLFNAVAALRYWF